MKPVLDRLHPHRIRGAQEDMESSRQVAQQVRAAAPDDDDVAASRRLLDHVLGDLEHGFPGVKRGVGVGRRPGGGLGRDQRFGAGRAQCHEQAGQQ